jgi:signal peptidase
MTLKTAKKILMALTLTLLVGVSALGVVTKLQGGNLLSVQSKSMVPYLSKGDLVSVKRVPGSELRTGDVVTFISPLDARETITHRIIQTPSWQNGQHFRTKGDANSSPDPQITAKDIVGRVSYSVPLLGYGADFMRRPLGLILVVYIPALIIIGSELKRLAQYYKTRESYVLPGHPSLLLHNKESHGLPLLKLLPILFALPLLWVVKANAQISSTATLSGNTISTKAVTPPPPDTGGGTVITCVNTNNVNVNSSNNQSATSGSTNNSGNTTGGNATSGNASNNNTTNVQVNINNGTCTAIPATP